MRVMRYIGRKNSLRGTGKIEMNKARVNLCTVKNVVADTKAKRATGQARPEDDNA